MDGSVAVAGEMNEVVAILQVQFSLCLRNSYSLFLHIYWVFLGPPWNLCNSKLKVGKNSGTQVLFCANRDTSGT